MVVGKSRHPSWKCMCCAVGFGGGDFQGWADVVPDHFRVLNKAAVKPWEEQILVYVDLREW